ncbi:hypothetical protein C8A03DRAFT_39681, partial [Achaetomium macrosporum]
KAKRRVIGFGCKVPFERLPKLVEDGFERLGRIFEKGDRRVLDHYQAARNLLERCLGDPLYDLMMMLTLTVAASSATPQVAPGSRGFSAAARRKEPELLAANMVTRMLWFMRPQSFPWDADEKGVLRVSEMTKKIEHKGVNNRVLRALGWIDVQGRRDSPRNSECSLRPAEELYKLRQELLSLRKEPEAFILKVFRSADKVWVDRCSSIVVDR